VGLVIVVEAKLVVLLEVSRTRSGATQILQSQFFDVFKGFALTAELLVQLQRTVPLLAPTQWIAEANFRIG
jgi:hypothetical protein